MNGDLPGAYATWNRATTLWPVERRDSAFARFYSTRSLDVVLGRRLRGLRPDGQGGARAGLEASMLEASVTSACNVGLALVGLSQLEEGIEWLEKSIALGSDWEEHAFRFTSRSMNMRAGGLAGARGLGRRPRPEPRGLRAGEASGFPPAAVASHSTSSTWI